MSDSEPSSRVDLAQKRLSALSFASRELLIRSSGDRRWQGTPLSIQR